MKRFFKWLDSKLPDPPKRGVYIGDALLDCTVFTNLKDRVHTLEERTSELEHLPFLETLTVLGDRLNRVEKAVDALKSTESYRGSAHPLETSVRASVSD